MFGWFWIFGLRLGGWWLVLMLVLWIEIQRVWGCRWVWWSKTVVGSLYLSMKVPGPDAIEC